MTPATSRHRPSMRSARTLEGIRPALQGAWQMKRWPDTIGFIGLGIMGAPMAGHLVRAGYRVLAAANGGEALLICERYDGPIHLLVTDIIMPGMSGRELANRLAPLRPQMKVLYMSGYTDRAVVANGVLEDHVDFLQKPFTAEDLKQRVREILDRKRC